MISDRIVVFDDPICSLDNDTLFVVSTLIRELWNDTTNAWSRVKHIFILSHNIYFHKGVTFKVDKNKASYWLLKKNKERSIIERQNENPITTGYELLWREVREATFGNRDAISIQNTLRRILETYFRLLGGIKLDDLINRFDGEDKLRCRALLSWVHDGSHSMFGEEYYTPLDDNAIHRYLEVFRQIFEIEGHIAHYNMMLRDEKKTVATPLV